MNGISSLIIEKYAKIKINEELSKTKRIQQSPLLSPMLYTNCELRNTREAFFIIKVANDAILTVKNEDDL